MCVKAKLIYATVETVLFYFYILNRYFFGGHIGLNLLQFYLFILLFLLLF